MVAFKRWIALAVACLLGSAATAAIWSSAPAPARLTQSPLGDTLPWLAMKTPAGEPVNLHDRLRGHAALIYVVNEAECASCSNLPLEFRIIKKETPGVEPMIVGSGGPPKAFVPYLERMNLASAAMIDEPRSLLHALGLSAEPVAILVDSTGRMLFVDLRSNSKAAQFPMGRVLHDLAAIFGQLSLRPRLRDTADR